MREIVTSLEMTSRDQLIPGHPAPAAIDLEGVGPASARVARETYVRIWEPLAAIGRTAWSDEQWADELSRPGVHAWIAAVRGEVAGLVELEAESDDAVGIVVFGLVPTFTGKGYGAEFLIRATELAWQLRTDKPTRRVWLQTSSLDHPHALSNYERRGFRRFASTIVDGGSERVHDRQIGRGGDAWQP